MPLTDTLFILAIISGILGLLYADREFFLVLAKRDKLHLVLGWTLLAAVAMILPVEWFAGLLTDDTWLEIIIYTAVWAVPLTLGTFVSGMRGEYGPDWREGLRRYLRWAEAEDRRWKAYWEREQRINAWLRIDGERWYKEKFAAYEMPENPEWYPPDGVKWDGSTTEAESEHIADLRRRFPAWYRRHGQ